MITVLLVASALVAAPHMAATDSLTSTTAAGVSVRLIRVNLADTRVHVAIQTAHGCPSGAEPFECLLLRSHPTIAVNGAYFSKETLKPIGDLVCGGKTVTQGMMGTALAITKDNEALIRRVKWGHAEDWSEYETVMGCGPALVLDGRIDVEPEAEGFHDPHVMTSTRRTGVGLTKDHCLLIVHSLAPVTFRKWAEVMLALRCDSAMNLDAGASTAMYYRGRTIIRPGRNLTNLLVVKVDEKTESAADSQK